MSNYDDIINHPHHQSSTRPHMSLYDRAAQFSPFAALTGYEESVVETARLTNERIDLTDDAIEIINNKLRYLEDNISNRPKINVTYFVPDELKEGGEYVTVEKSIKKIDTYENILVFEDNSKVCITDILDLEY